MLPNQSPILPPPSASCCCLRLRASCSARPRTYSISRNRATRLSLAIVALNIIVPYRRARCETGRFDIAAFALQSRRARDVGERRVVLRRILSFYLFTERIDRKIRGTLVCSRLAQLFQRSPSVVVADGLKKKRRFTPYYDQFPSYRWHHSHGTFSPPLAVNYSVYKRRT